MLYRCQGVVTVFSALMYNQRGQAVSPVGAFICGCQVLAGKDVKAPYSSSV